MKMPSASVIIPCYNNSSVLQETLRGLQGQSLPLDQFEVLIVDDGSTEDLRQIVADLRVPKSYLYLRQPNRGAAAARNRGAHQSHGDVLIFLDSDVIPDPTLVEEHLRCHDRHDLALVVGRTQAISIDQPDVFYRIMGKTLFAFDLGEEEKSLEFRQVISRNLSMRRSVFLRIGDFDEGFPRSGFEDVDFAYRASQLGFEAIYNPDAAGMHNHIGDLAQVGQHMYGYQASAALLLRKHPEIKECIPHLLDKKPIDWRRDDPRLVLRKLRRWLFALRPFQWVVSRTITVFERWYPNSRILRLLYWQSLGTFLYLGFRHGLRRYGSSA